MAVDREIVGRDTVELEIPEVGADECCCWRWCCCIADRACCVLSVDLGLEEKN